MNLSKPTHNMMSNIYASSKQLAPEVGMGATELMYTDRHACTIIAVKSPTRIVLQRDTATRSDENGMSDSQRYEYAPNPEAAKFEASLRKNGRWIKSGESARNGTTIAIGFRKEYHDYGF